MVAQFLAGHAGFGGLPLRTGQPREADSDAVFAELLFVAAVAVARELELPASAPKLYAVSARAADLGGDAIARDLDLADGAVVEVLFPGAEMLVAGELPQERAVEEVIGWGRGHGRREVLYNTSAGFNFQTPMVKTLTVYEGDLHCSVTHGPSGRVLETDAPVDNQGRGESFSPTDLMGVALGSCMATTMGIKARQMGIELEGMRVEVIKEMSADAPRRIAKLTAEIWLPVPRSADPEGILEAAAHGCPVHRSLHPEVEKPVVFHWAGEA